MFQFFHLRDKIVTLVINAPHCDQLQNFYKYQRLILLLYPLVLLQNNFITYCNKVLKDMLMKRKLRKCPKSGILS